MKIAGHCIRNPEQLAHQLILWEPSQGKANVSHRRLNYIDILSKNSGLLDNQEIRTRMLDIDVLLDLSHIDARVEDQ